MGTPFDNFQKFEGQAVAQETTPNPEGQGMTEQSGGQQTAAPTEQPPVATQGAPAKADEFIETFNKRFNTQYKADEEIKGLFEYPKKVTEYEGKLKDYDSVKKSADQYKQDLENLKKTEAERYFSSPLMKKAFVADQLVKKFPHSDVTTLTELAMSDVNALSDLDVLAKEIKIKLPSKNIEAIKSAILSDVGIDATTDPKEWDEVAQTKLAIRAGTARENIRNLVDGIQLPKIETKEESDARMATELSKKIEMTTPQKNEYLKFDKFKVKDDLEYTVPDEFKSKLGDMFDAFIINAGNEPTQENIDTLNDLREALFFSSHKDKIYEMMYKDAESKIKAELDKKLGNTTPPNTATASDGAGTEQPTNDGMEYLKNLRNQGRATKI